MKLLKAAAVSLFMLVYPDPEGKEPTDRQLVGFYVLLFVAACCVVAWNW